MHVSCGRNIGMRSVPFQQLLNQIQLQYGQRWLMIGIVTIQSPILMMNHRIVSRFSTTSIYYGQCADIYYLATRLQDVHLELAKEDAEMAKDGAVSPHTTSLTEFLMKGLEIEEQQYIFCLCYLTRYRDLFYSIHFKMNVRV
jgi:hypothetical protein